MKLGKAIKNKNNDKIVPGTVLMIGGRPAIVIQNLSGTYAIADINSGKIISVWCETLKELQQRASLANASIVKGKYEVDF